MKKKKMRSRRVGRLRIAVMSDLHCQLASEGTNDSFLKVGSLRSPASQHPIQALLSLIEEQNLETDVLLVPGDLTNKISLKGLSQAWDLAAEVGRALASSHVIPVLGNHDVDSRKLRNPDPLHFARNLRPGFPLEHAQANARFFSDGCCLIAVRQWAQLVVVNSVVDHFDESSAKRGAFGDARIEALKGILEQGAAAPIRVGVMHHHPVLHSSKFLTENDVIPTGDRLLGALRKNGVGLVIHGHKHHPRLTYAPTDHGEVPVFAAGSFAAMLGAVGTVTRNLFHLVEVEVQNSIERPLCGKILTWEWQLGTGWVSADQHSADFPFATGFGRTHTIDDIATRLVQFVGTQDGRFQFTEGELLKISKDLRYLTPTDYEMLSGVLLEDGLRLWREPKGALALGKLYP